MKLDVFAKRPEGPGGFSRAELTASRASAKGRLPNRGQVGPAVDSTWAVTACAVPVGLLACLQAAQATEEGTQIGDQ